MKPKWDSSKHALKKHRCPGCFKEMYGNTFYNHIKSCDSYKVWKEARRIEHEKAHKKWEKEHA